MTSMRWASGLSASIVSWASSAIETVAPLAGVLPRFDPGVFDELVEQCLDVVELPGEDPEVARRRPAFDKLEDQLGKAMDQSRTHLRNDVLNARSGLSGAQVGGVVLSLGAAIAVALGLWPRLKEYR